MNRTKFWRITSLCVLPVVVLCCLTIQAKPPSGGGEVPPSGVIYFQFDWQTNLMNSDGTGKSTVPVGGYWGLPFEPSHAEHAGARWFLFVTRGPAIAVVNDYGTKLILNAPGDDGDWEVVDEKLRWVFDYQAAAVGLDGTDGLVSWVAVRRNDDGDVIDAAVCAAPVLYDPLSGDVAGLDLASVARFHDASPDYDWSPDGTAIVYSSSNQLFINDTIDRVVVPLPVENGIDPAWSPDGTAIAFADRRELVDRIVTIRLDGLTQDTLMTARRRNALEGTYLFRPQWSPQGTHLIYERGDTKGFNEEYHIWRIRSDGKLAVNLTGDLNTSFGIWGVGWR